MNVDKPVFTHGFITKANDQSDAERQVRVSRCERGNTYFQVETKWPGQDEPSITRIAFSPEGFQVFIAAVATAVEDMERFRFPSPSREKEEA